MITITKVTNDQINDLKYISINTFVETFAHCNTEANMQRYLAESLNDEALQKQVDNPESEFYLAKLNEGVIGYLKVNKGSAQTELQEEDSLEIERIYVSKDFQGKAVGQLLFEKAIAIARSIQAKYIWLGVWEHNKRAVAFYKKNGFVEFGEHHFKFGDEMQTDMMMKLELNYGS